MNLELAQYVRGMGGKVTARWRQMGPWITFMTILRKLFKPLVQYQHLFIWEVALDSPRSHSIWAPDERMTIIGPEMIDSVINPRLMRFLGGERAADDLEGVRGGDQLLLVENETGYVYSGYIYFDTTRQTRRQKKIYGEGNGTPVVGTCVSRPIKIWSVKAEQLQPGGELAARLKTLLPAGTDLQCAASGFKDLGQFLYTAYVSHSLEIPFDQLKQRVVSGDSLWQAIHVLRPDVDAIAETRKAWEEASIHRRVLNEAFLYLQGLGYRRAINAVEAKNDASHKANAAVGMRICREVRYWKLVKHLVVQRGKEDTHSYWRWFGI